jgi:DNA modification methylase
MAILDVTDMAKTVYDPFLGSGGTLIAAHRLGRVCYGCELDPKYADAVLRRAEAEGLTCERTDG